MVRAVDTQPAAAPDPRLAPAPGHTRDARLAGGPRWAPTSHPALAGRAACPR